MIVSLVSPRTQMVVFSDDRPKALVMALGSDGAERSIWGTLQRLEAPVQAMYVEPIDHIEPLCGFFPVQPYERVNEEDAPEDSWTFEARSAIDLGEGAFIRRIVRIELLKIDRHWVASLQSLDKFGQVDQIAAELVMAEYQPDANPMRLPREVKEISAWDRLDTLV